LPGFARNAQPPLDGVGVSPRTNSDSFLPLGANLMTFEVPASESEAFEAFLAGLDYRFLLDESNDAYRRFVTHDSQRAGD